MKQPDAEEEPEAEGVQPRERHVPRADHQRHEVVPERAGRHRDDEEEDHRDPVHRQKLVVGPGADDPRRSARRAACASVSASDAAGGEEGERCEQIEQADPLVVGRREPAEHAWTRLPDALEPREPLGRQRQLATVVTAGSPDSGSAQSSVPGPAGAPACSLPASRAADRRSRSAARQDRCAM